MSLQQALVRARGCVQRGQIDSAIKLYRGLLVSMAHHPQVNADLVYCCCSTARHKML